jgi:hypothetical protein
MRSADRYRQIPTHRQTDVARMVRRAVFDRLLFIDEMDTGLDIEWMTVDGACCRWMDGDTVCMNSVGGMGGMDGWSMQIRIKSIYIIDMTWLLCCCYSWCELSCLVSGLFLLGLGC